MDCAFEIHAINGMFAPHTAVAGEGLCLCPHMSPYEDNLKGLVRALAYCPLMVKAKQGKSAFNRPSHLVQALLMLAESLVVCVGMHIAARKHRNPLLIIPERGL